jgi:ABC-type branched-subunit amino acid transport system substrate-binding protein
MKRLAVAAMASALVLAGCGGSDDGSGGDATGPIELYQIIPTESQVASLPFIGTAAEAAVEEINEAGGVNGRKIELTTCNDKFDPNEALRCAQKAERAGAVALVGGLTQYGAQVYPVLEKANIASIGADAVTPADATSPISYLMDPGVPGLAASPGIAKKFLGADKVVIMDLDSSAAESNKSYYEIGAKEAGVEIVDQILIPVDAIDYAQYVSRAEASGAKVIVTAMTDQATLKTFAAIKGSGSDLKMIGSSSSLRADVVAEAGEVANGSYAVSGTPNGDSSNEWGQQYLAAMKKYQPKEKVFGSLGLRAYASVHLFAQVAGTIDGTIDAKSVRTALDGVHDMKFMWIDSLSFDKPGPISKLPRIVNPSVYPIEVKGGALVSGDSFDPFE